MNRFARAFSLERNLARLLHPPEARFRPVDGFRALAVLWVILMHCLWFQFPFAKPGDFAAFFERQPRWIIGGPYGVDIFFVISGFLIGHILMEEFERRGNIRARRFFSRRFLRLMPAYIVAMGIYAVTLRQNRDMLWTNLIYINNFVDGVKQAMPWTWSLAIEEQFYFTFPFFLIFVFYAVRQTRRTMLLWVVVGVSLLIRAFVILRHGLHLPVPWSAGVTDANFLNWAEALYIKPYTRFGSLALGVLAAHFVLNGSARNFFQSRPRWALAGFGCSILTIVSIVMAPIQMAGPRWHDVASLLVLTSHCTLFGAATAFLLLYCLYPVSGPGRLLEAFLSWRPFRSLAQLAYSAYLLHPIVLTMLYSSIASNLQSYPMVVYYIAGPILSFAAAAVLYLLLERPFMNLRDEPATAKEMSPAEMPLRTQPRLVIGPRASQ